ncbi:hypothetical protein TWF730_003080 [Orbilia blumenaviensis]|uniref:DNA 3'-5' helicase n=1 Tax=Orbilia blumenaviensis TaxID=1796055 RepID=A0AAV9U8M8_9PEZI
MAETGIYVPIVKETTRPLFQQLNLIEYEVEGLLAVVCSSCKYLFPASHVQSHLEGHKHKFEQKTLRSLGILPLLEQGRWATYEQLRELRETFARRKIRPLPHLEVRKGFQCRFCHRCYSTDNSLATHRGRCPSDTRPKPRRYDKITEADKIDCQVWFFAMGQTFHPVYPEAAAALVEKDENVAALLKLREDISKIPDGSSDQVTPVPWLLRTGWPDFCGGDRAFIAEKLAPLAKQSGRGPVTHRIIQATQALFKSFIPYIKETTVYFRRVLKAPHNEIDNRPFDRKQGEATEAEYMAMMVRMVIYVCSVYELSPTDTAKTGIDLEPYEDLLRDIMGYASTNRTDEEIADEDGEAAFQSAFQSSIRNFIIKCISTELPAASRSRFEHPIFNFLAVIGFNEQKGTWRPANLCTKPFACMSFSTRLCVLGESWLRAKVDAASNVDIYSTSVAEEENKLANLYFARHFDILVKVTKDTNRYPMSEWLGLHAYAKAITESDFMPGDLDWTKEGDGIIYGGEIFKIRPYRSFIRSLNPDIRGRLKNLMFLKPEDDLPSIDLNTLSDDNPDPALGYSFVNDPKNAVHFEPDFVFNKIKDSEDLIKEFYSQPGVLSHRAIRGYLKKDAELRATFAIAVLLTAGGPPRGTELLSLRKHNTLNNIRNFYVNNGDLMVFTDYNKVNSMVGYSKGICRYLPPNIAEAFVIYMFKVDPVVDYFRSKVGRKVSPILFCDDNGEALETDFISNFLKLRAMEGIGYPLKIKSYRQIIVAITREHVAEMADIIERHVEKMKSKHAEQTGHTDKVDLQCYGVTKSRLKDSDEISTMAFRKATVRLQFFIGAIDRLPDWMLLPSKIWWPGSEASDQHPRFLHPAYPEQFLIESVPEQVQPSRQAQIVVQPSGPAPLGILNNLPFTHMLPQDSPDIPQLPSTMEYQRFGLPAWKLPEQAAAAKAIYQRNVSPLLITLACAAGKTTAALLAIAAGNGVSIIIEPYISTCKDVAKRAKAMGIHTSYWGDLEDGEVVGKSFPKNTPGVVIATPEAAITWRFLSQVGKFISERRLDVVIIDEIHQPLLDQGFRDLAALAKYTNLGLPFICMTATMPPLMVAALQAFCSVPSFLEIRSTTNIKNISYKVHIAKHLSTDAVNAAKVALKTVSKRKDKKDAKIIVYCRSIYLTDVVSKGLGCPKYNGEMKPEERDKNKLKWEEEGGVLAATCCLGPGVDTKGVIAVIHAGIPYSLVEFVQQTARAGREGQPMAFSTLITGKIQFDPADYYGQPQWRVESYKALCDLVSTTNCRRLAISQFMDGKGKGVDCFMIGGVLCDNCTGISNMEAEPDLEQPRGPQLNFNQAKARQAERIFRFLKASETLCSYCFFLEGSLSDHSYSHCTKKSVPLKPASFPKDKVCAYCGIPTEYCMMASGGESCKQFRSCWSIYSAVFADVDIKERLFVELGIQGLGISTWAKWEKWLTTTSLESRKYYSNAWLLLRKLEELLYFSVFSR